MTNPGAPGPKNQGYIPTSPSHPPPPYLQFTYIMHTLSWGNKNLCQKEDPRKMFFQKMYRHRFRHKWVQTVGFISGQFVYFCIKIKKELPIQSWPCTCPRTWSSNIWSQILSMNSKLCWSKVKLMYWSFFFPVCICGNRLYTPFVSWLYWIDHFNVNLTPVEGAGAHRPEIGRFVCDKVWLISCTTLTRSHWQVDKVNTN